MPKFRVAIQESDYAILEIIADNEMEAQALAELQLSSPDFNARDLQWYCYEHDDTYQVSWIEFVE